MSHIKQTPVFHMVPIQLLQLQLSAHFLQDYPYVDSFHSNFINTRLSPTRWQGHFGDSISITKQTRVSMCLKQGYPAPHSVAFIKLMQTSLHAITGIAQAKSCQIKNTTDNNIPVFFSSCYYNIIFTTNQLNYRFAQTSFKKLSPVFST